LEQPGEFQVTAYRCRCDREWIPRNKGERPRVCPKCKSPNWDRPRKRPNMLPLFVEEEQSQNKGVAAIQPRYYLNNIKGETYWQDVHLTYDLVQIDG